MATIPLLASTPTNAEASQIIGTVNGVIQNINANALIGSVAPTSLRNILIGSDFNTNPWQRGTSFTGIANTVTYTADRWFAVGNASASISVSQQTGTPVPGFGAQARVQRASANADTHQINFVSIVESADVLQTQGLPVIISFYARAGAGFTSANSALGVTITTGTNANEGAATYISGWTGAATPTLYNSTGAAATSVTLSTSFQRFALVTNIATAALELAVQFSFTGVGTAGASDYFEIEAIQLEVAPQGGTNATPFERRPIPLELALCQRYTQVLSQVVGASVSPIALGTGSSATVARLPLPVKVPFRVAPTTTYPIGKAGGFILQGQKGSMCGSALLTQLATSTVFSVYAQATVSATAVVKTTALLVGTGVAGPGAQANQIVMSAEL